ncbi:hypothetical protein BGZ95_001204 [Linnemannia exigua]|uniref:Uncharacterized protein n=1 Tax=Linnemannia exigua TaxID=604196 RepID=A0AAD4HA76_9FUNG|nr:hypothetical protein BGZ95_001204 [Linnemannia exigua]
MAMTNGGRGGDDGGEETALKVWNAFNAFRTKAFYEQDEAAINTRWKEEAQERERQLLMTLMSTLVQDLCLRFPAIADAFLPPPASSPSVSTSTSTSAPSSSKTMASVHTDDTKHKRTLDLGPYFREVTWTSQHYLQHWTVMDLEKLSTRGRHLHYTAYEAFGNGDAMDNDGLYNYLFRHSKSMIGVPEYLQRAFLNGIGTGGGRNGGSESGGWSGAGRIEALRIPIRRMRSFQDRQERAPRPRAKKTKTTTTTMSSTLSISEENKDANEGTVFKATPHIVDESLRPYCFKLDKLTHLRRIEICNLSQNDCDWETLRRALLTLEYGPSSGSGGGVDVQAPSMKGVDKTTKKRPSKIRELSLTIQATIGPAIDEVLDCFAGLEVLEIMAPSFQCYAWVSNWNPTLCQNLRVLRVGDLGRLVTDKTSLKDLGRFCRLEELRLRVDYDSAFQWVVDAKKEAWAKAKANKAMETIGLQGSLSSSSEKTTGVSGRRASRNSNNMVDLTGEDPLSHCLPRLKRLGIFSRNNLSLNVVATTTEAFGDQLEELVLSFSGNEGPILFTNPSPNANLKHSHISLPNLTRLALRFTNLQRLQLDNLAQHCPALEWIVLQHMWYSGGHLDYDSTLERRQDYDRLNDSVVRELTQFTKLRTVYFEGHSTMRGEQMRTLVDGCLSLRRVGVHNMPAVTTEEWVEMDTVLSCREERFPLLQRGVYRIPSRMSNYMDQDFHWRIAHFGYDLHE